MTFTVPLELTAWTATWRGQEDIFDIACYLSLSLYAYIYIYMHTHLISCSLYSCHLGEKGTGDRDRKTYMLLCWMLMFVLNICWTRLLGTLPCWMFTLLDVDLGGQKDLLVIV